jgi:hypothetical protein
MAKRLDAASLKARVRDRGFTPSARDVAALLELLVDHDEAVVRDAERAIQRVGAAAVPIAVAGASGANAPLRARIARILGRLAADGPEQATRVAVTFLAGALADEDARVRRYAATALGKIPKGSPDIEQALLDAWDRETRIDVQRTLAEALGKAGSIRARERVAVAAAAADAELARIAARALLRIERDDLRSAESSIDASRVLADPVHLIVHCRAGLEGLVRDEIKERCGAGVTAGDACGPGALRATLRGPMEDLWRVRTLLDFAVDLGVARSPGVEHGLVLAMTSEPARRVIEGLTTGTVRYRIAWGSGGHRRAAVLRVARAIADVRPDWVNDPKDSSWEVVAFERGESASFELRPRALPDPRFTYRKRDVPGASHPTLAAALVRVAGVRADDVVWDPFVGSATELIERAKAGPYARLLGSDIDSRALQGARVNLEAVALRGVELREVDALAHAPAGVTLILTNPPMGRRVARRADLARQLDAFVGHAARVLVPGGRLAWIAPWPDRALDVARASGLRRECVLDIDMGGFPAQLQRFASPDRA